MRTTPTLPLDQLVPDPISRLAASIKQHGILQHPGRRGLFFPSGLLGNLSVGATKRTAVVNTEMDRETMNRLKTPTWIVFYASPA